MDKIRKQNRRKSLSPYLLVLLSFLIIILIGGFLLSCPFSTKNGRWGNFINAIFTAVSSTCVTGLSVYENGIVEEFNLFGQILMCLMIQIGGLGFITILTFIITLVRKKIQFKDRFLLAKAVNAANIGDMIKFVRKIIIISFAFEIIGFLLLIPPYLQMFKNNISVGLWRALFHSVSAFNNAGFDLLGNSSLVKGLGNPLIDNLANWAYIYLQIVTMLLIIFGGLSFVAIIEIFSIKKSPKQYTTFTKIVLSMTGILIVFGTLLLLISDGLKSVNRMSVLDALFQSVTCRTAGFTTYNQANLSVMGRIVSCLLMLIGGSPLSTAGGIKTTTVFLIFLAMYKYLSGKKVSAFKRSYSHKMVLKAMSLLLIALSTILISYLLVVTFENGNTHVPERGALLFEIFSAFNTVGNTVGITPYLSIGTKIVLCILMFMGRLGPITLFQIFQKNIDKEEKLHYEYVQEDFLVG